MSDAMETPHHRKQWKKSLKHYKKQQKQNVCEKSKKKTANAAFLFENFIPLHFLSKSQLLV